MNTMANDDQTATVKLTEIYHLLSDSVGEQRYESKDALRYVIGDVESLVKSGKVVTIWKTTEIKSQTEV